MGKRRIIMLVLSALLLTVGHGPASSPPAHKDSDNDSLVGSWRSRVQFKTGAFSAVKDLEFMYAFHSGGTMNESSNYDAAPPVPPAYGVWRKIQPRKYEAKYAFFVSKAPKAFDDIAKAGGWLPGGSGVLTERITLSEDGRTFQSTIRLDVFDEAGKPTEIQSEAEGQAVHIGF
jgi:hypothetical protein